MTMLVLSALLSFRRPRAILSSTPRSLNNPPLGWSSWQAYLTIEALGEADELSELEPRNFNGSTRQTVDLAIFREPRGRRAAIVRGFSWTRRFLLSRWPRGDRSSDRSVRRLGTSSRTTPREPPCTLGFILPLILFYPLSSFLVRVRASRNASSAVIATTNTNAAASIYFRTLRTYIYIYIHIHS